MGDRGNIRMDYSGGQKIYFYTHWEGSYLPEALQSALQRGRSRWDDDSYLARIIFCEMISGDVTGTTSFGIAPYICDNEHNILVVDCKKQQVHLLQYILDYRPDHDHQEGDILASWTFEEFATGDIEEIRRQFGKDMVFIEDKSNG